MRERESGQNISGRWHSCGRNGTFPVSQTIPFLAWTDVQYVKLPSILLTPHAALTGKTNSHRGITGLEYSH
jgi:hypothetical protein